MKSRIDAPIKPLSLKDLERHLVIDILIVESLEQALYRVVVEIEGQRYFVTESPGKSLTRRNILDILVLFKPFSIGKLYLKHSSPYDEMIGLSEENSDNELLVPLGNYFTQELGTTH